ncbi:MAG: transcription antitermination factor NusB [Ruthenibacterium lactatiformans]
MKRRIARENAFIAAFEASFNANSIEEIVAASREQDEYAVDAYGNAAGKLLRTQRRSGRSDQARLKDWTLARLPRVNAPSRLAVTEMRFNGSDDMDSIVINEAVELAKKYAGEEDYQFINGVLGAISREAHSAKADEPAVPADSASEEA